MDYLSPGSRDCFARNDLKIKIKDKSKKIKVESRKNEDRRQKKYVLNRDFQIFIFATAENKKFPCYFADSFD